MLSKLSKLIPLLVAVILAVTASSASAAAGDTATGSGLTQAGEAFSFSAVGTDEPFPNSATGVMSYSGEAPQLGEFFSGTATVICLVVEDNRAALRGAITASVTHPELVGSGRLRFYAEDNALPGAGQDRFAGSPFDTFDFGCGGVGLPPAAGGGSLVTAGEIVVSGCENPKEHKKDPDKDKCKDKQDKG